MSTLSLCNQQHCSMLPFARRFILQKLLDNRRGTKFREIILCLYLQVVYRYILMFLPSIDIRQNITRCSQAAAARWVWPAGRTKKVEILSAEGSVQDPYRSVITYTTETHKPWKMTDISRLQPVAANADIWTNEKKNSRYICHVSWSLLSRVWYMVDICHSWPKTTNQKDHQREHVYSFRSVHWHYIVSYMALLRKRRVQKVTISHLHAQHKESMSLFPSCHSCWPKAACFPPMCPGNAIIITKNQKYTKQGIRG